LDADGDGVADAPVLGAALPDANGDGVPDHLQALESGIVLTGQGWGGSGGCSVMPMLSTTAQPKRIDPMLPLLVVRQRVVN